MASTANAAALCCHSPPLRPTCRHHLLLQRLHHSWPSGGSTTSLLSLRRHAHELVGFRPHRVDRRRSARKKIFFPTQCKVESIVEGEFGDKVLRSDVPVLVEFVADWCGPCRLVAPAVEWASQVIYSSSLYIKLFHFNLRLLFFLLMKNLQRSQPIKSINQFASVDWHLH